MLLYINKQGKTRMTTFHFKMNFILARGTVVAVILW